MNGDQLLVITIVVVILAVLFARKGWWNGTEFGNASWASEGLLRATGMLGKVGLVLGRTASGKLIRLSSYCHVLLVGPTGSGKGVSVIVPLLLTYLRNSLMCFDTKGDLHATTAGRRAAAGQRIIRLAPFNQGTDSFNPLDAIPKNSPLLVDLARALAESLVVRTGKESEAHWNDKAVQVICALLVFVLLRVEGVARSLNSVQEIASDQELLANTAEKLREMDGIPGRLGNQLKTLFDKGPPVVLTKEGAGVLSTVARHLSFLDSELVALSVATSTFNAVDLCKPGVTLYLQIPPDMLEAQ